MHALRIISIAAVQLLHGISLHYVELCITHLCSWCSCTASLPIYITVQATSIIRHHTKLHPKVYV